MQAAAWLVVPVASCFWKNTRFTALSAAVVSAATLGAPAAFAESTATGTAPQVATVETSDSKTSDIAAALAKPVELSYEVYFSGMNIMRADARMIMRDGSYRLEADGNTKGLADFFASWQGATFTEGRFDAEGRAVPEHHRQESSWKGEAREIDIKYDADGQVNGVSVAPPPDLDEVTEMPEGAEIDTIDAVTVFAQQSRRITAGLGCDAKYAVYDGRRRFDLTITSGGMEIIEPNAYSVYNGAAEACRVKIELLGGEQKDKSKYAKTARNRTVYVARPLADGPAVPVRMRIDTDYGVLMAHLTRISDGDRQIALNVDD
ncbi:MAG: DUF3108 domain-containing protein [Alphaproteobacteria bacterium]|nr:DUF3108 domain-containing protein [Alphaproteobacteria bacterium]